MAVKTITVTEAAYNALFAEKKEHESFSKTILRITDKKPLSTFFGTLSEESAAKIEKTIRESRRLHAKQREKRMKGICDALGG